MNKESTKNYLLLGIALIIFQNSLLILIFGGAIADLNFDFLKLLLTLTYWLDLIGYGLIGIGLYYLSTYKKSVVSPALTTSQLVFGWIALSVIWRLMLGVLIPNFYILGKLNIENLGIHATLPPTIFGIAGFALLLSILNLNVILKSFQKQELINSKISQYFLVYAFIHIIGVVMIVIGWNSIAKIVLNPNSSSYYEITSTVGGLFLAGFGFLIKIFIVPIIAIIAYSELYKAFKTIG
jgi:hypothetical protein